MSGGCISYSTQCLEVVLATAHSRFTNRLSPRTESVLLQFVEMKVTSSTALSGPGSSCARLEPSARDGPGLWLELVAAKTGVAQDTVQSVLP